MVSFNLFGFTNKQTYNQLCSFILWHFVANENFESSCNDLNDTVLQVKTAISSTKEDKATTQILNLNTKTIEINISFITSNDFRRLSPFVFVMPTPKHKYQCLLILVQRSQCPVYIFKNLCVDCFRYKLSSVWSYIFFLNGPDKKPKQNSSKTKRHSRQQEAKSFRRRTAVSQQNFFWRCHSDFALIGQCTLSIVFSGI